jgi:hypothetical protein
MGKKKAGRKELTAGHGPLCLRRKKTTDWSYNIGSIQLGRLRRGTYRCLAVGTVESRKCHGCGSVKDDGSFRDREHPVFHHRGDCQSQTCLRALCQMCIDHTCTSCNMLLVHRCPCCKGIRVQTHRSRRPAGQHYASCSGTQNCWPWIVANTKALFT